MTKMAAFVRKLFRSDKRLHLKLRKAVVQNKPRLVAELIDDGASPFWTRPHTAPHDVNALLLACQRGDAHILDLLLDACFTQQERLNVWARHMYCIVIREGHWDAFRRLHDRRIPLQGTTSNNPSLPIASAKMPSPQFIAAEHGRDQILSFLLMQYRSDWTRYTFNGHTLLSIASKNGHYDCVEVLLASAVVNREPLEFAINCARRFHQAHVLVLLTSCLPEYFSDREPLSKAAPMSNPVSFSQGRPSQQRPTCSARPGASVGGTGIYPRAQNRGSTAETEVMDDYGDEERRSSIWMLEAGDSSTSSSGPRSNSSDEEDLRATMDGFAILEAARRAESRDRHRRSETDELTWDSPPLSGSSSISYHSCNEEPPRSNLELEDDPRWYVERDASDFDFHQQFDAEDPNETEPEEASSPPLPQPQPPVSRKIISIRSQRASHYVTLPSIKEHPTEIASQ